MIRPSSRSVAWSWASKWSQAEGVGSAARKATISWPMREMTGRSRRASGNREAAKGVASSAAAAVAWSIEAIPLVKRSGLVTTNPPRSRLIFKPPARSSTGLKALSGRKSCDFRRNTWHWRDYTRSDQAQPTQCIQQHVSDRREEQPDLVGAHRLSAG